MKKLFIILFVLCMTAICASLADSSETPEPPLDSNQTVVKQFQNVPVTIAGEAALQYKGMIITNDLEAMLENVSVTAEIPRQYEDQAEAAAYQLYVDLSPIRKTGRHELKILDSAGSPYGRIISINPSYVVIDVERNVTLRHIPLDLRIEGEPPEGWYIDGFVEDPNMFSVTGPHTTVNRITRGQVTVDCGIIPWEEREFRMSADISLLSRKGEEISDSLLTISRDDGVAIDRAIVDLTILPVKTFPAEDTVRVEGEPADGYRVTRVHISPEYVEVAAPERILNALTLLGTDSSIDISGLQSNSVFQVKVLSPSDEAVMLHDILTVLVEVEKTAPEFSTPAATPVPAPAQAAVERLNSFLFYWAANRLDDMLTLCAPSWMSEQEHPKSSLFFILKNSTPVEYAVVNIIETGADSSCQVILTIKMDRHNGKEPMFYRITVRMLKEDGEWYADPASLESVELLEAANPDMTPAPVPTPVPSVDGSTPLYYNPDGGTMYHADPNCRVINPRFLPLKAYFLYGQVNESPYSELEPCNVCGAPLR